MRTRAAFLAAAFLAYGLGACGSGADDDGRDTLTVYAAASLREPFTELGERFTVERALAGERVEVELSFAGSADVAAQVDQGAPADVVATADEVSMARIAPGLLSGEPEVFATNTLTLVVPRDNPAGITGLGDLARPDVQLVVCAPEVPCGAATRRVAEESGVRLSPVSEEQSVTDVLGKVRAGEADAGLVYVTDAAAAGDAVRAVDVPRARDVVNAYPLAALADSEHPDLAAGFVEFVLGPVGEAVLTEAGFGRP